MNYHRVRATTTCTLAGAKQVCTEPLHESSPPLVRRPSTTTKYFPERRTTTWDEEAAEQAPGENRFRLAQQEKRRAYVYVYVYACAYAYVYVGPRLDHIPPCHPVRVARYVERSAKLLTV